MLRTWNIPSRSLLMLFFMAFSCQEEEFACKLELNNVLYGITTVNCDLGLGFQVRGFYGETDRVRVSADSLGMQTISFYPGNGATYTHVGTGVSWESDKVVFKVPLEYKGSSVGTLKGVCPCTSTTIP